MARKTRPISKVSFHVERAADVWRSVVAILREEAASPGYSGPSPASIARIAADIEATRKAVRVWFVAVASAPQDRRLRPAERAALAAALDDARRQA